MEEKIAKLLAMAEGTTNPHEAEAFMAQAEKLMLKYGIERAMVQRTGKREEITVVKVPVSGFASLALLALGHTMAEGFPIRTLQSKGLIWLIGHASDVRDAEQLLASLIVQAQAQAKNWWKTEGTYSGGRETYARREFIFAFASGVRSRLGESKDRAVAEAGSGTELVLVDRKKLVTNWVDDNLSVNAGRKTSRGYGGSAAVSAGFVAGREATGTKALS